MKTFKAFSLAIFLSSATLVGPNAMAKKSGNGDSYSGPTLAPKAVEISFDRAVKTEQLSKVIRNCLRDGKGNGFLEKLYQPMGKEFNIGRVGYDSESTMLTQFSAKIYKDIEVAAVSEAAKVTGFYEEELSISTSDKSDMRITHDYRFDPSKKRILLIKNMPLIKSEKQIVNSYDPLTGDLVSAVEYQKNIKIVYDLSNAPAYQDVINSTTGQKTSLLAPVADYANCLVDGIGNLE